MIALLINVLIVCLLLALIYWVLSMLPLPPNAARIIIAILAVFAVVYFLTGNTLYRYR